MAQFPSPWDDVNMMRTLILGMGNPILSDDAIGIRLAGDLRPAGSTPAARPSVST
jgi:Ni,Fe-hydrogenase maturation factor